MINMEYRKHTRNVHMIEHICKYSPLHRSMINLPILYLKIRTNKSGLIKKAVIKSTI